MKKDFKSILTFLLLGLFITTAMGCKKEGCTNEKAQNYNPKAKEDDGSCTYESDKFIGNYQVSENCDGSTNSYAMTINTNATDPSNLSILNLGDVFGNTFIVVAEVNGNQLSFHKNVLGAIFSGEGTLTDNTLTLDYSINNFGDIESCVATCTKQ